MDTRICLVDDDECIRDSLEALFRSRRLRASSFAEPARFLSVWQHSELREVPAVILLDVRMHGMSGIELFAAMQRHGLPAHNAVLFLTGHGDISLAVEAMKNGAADFLEKPFSDNSLVDRVIAVIRKVESVFESSRRFMDYDVLLSPREKDVAELIVDGQTNREIADRLLLSVRTVELHRSHIFEKLMVRNAIELVPFVRHARGDAEHLPGAASKAMRVG